MNGASFGGITALNVIRLQIGRGFICARFRRLSAYLSLRQHIIRDDPNYILRKYDTFATQVPLAHAKP